MPLPVLVRIRETWVLTVASLMYISAAIAALDLPAATASATSRSRSVRADSTLRAAAVRWSAAGWAARWTRRCVIVAEKTDSPAAATRTARAISVGGMSLSR